jgi:hypothetical protein
MGRAEAEKIAPIIGASTKGFLNTFSTKNMILVLTSEAPSISRMETVKRAVDVVAFDLYNPYDRKSRP